MTEIDHDDVAVFAKAAGKFTTFSREDVQAALGLIRVRELTRGAYLLRAGEYASEVAIVVRGLLREHFVLSDGTERTKAFITEGQTTGSLADLLSGAPSKAFIVAEEPSRVLVSPYAQLLQLSAQSAAWRELERRFLQALLLVKAEREYELLALDAQARYAAFSRRYPGLEARVAGRHIASYLGITAVHLSRIRRRRLVTQPPGAGPRSSPPLPCVADRPRR